jgi:hypothetical protein
MGVYCGCVVKEKEALDRHHEVMVFVTGINFS